MFGSIRKPQKHSSAHKNNQCYPTFQAAAFHLLIRDRFTSEFKITDEISVYTQNRSISEIAMLQQLEFDQDPRLDGSP